MDIDFEEALKNKYFNGAPVAYWETKADELVMEHLVRAAFNCDTNSIIGHIAGAKLIEIAKSINPIAFKHAVATRNKCLDGFAGLFDHLYNNKGE